MISTVSVCVHVYVCVSYWSHRHVEWPQFLQLHYLLAGEKTQVVVRIILSWPNQPCAPLHRCRLLTNGPTSLLPCYTHSQIWEWNKRWADRTLHNWIKLFSVSSSLHFEPYNLFFFQSAALPSPLLLSNTLLSFLLYCSPAPLLLFFFFCLQTENVRWANAIQSLTKGKLGLQLQGSDRLAPEARFSLSLASELWVSYFSFTHTYTYTLELNYAWGIPCSLWR